ncbi:TIR domain-containing protein [Portibacter marinus]|uniref:TIR domain-containing protein n=1 Tax=Portibacter marinus TaxID=2898660 RepID=UPI001F38E946|nr:TIR domain-containing protein [Portibacter marinus]
MSDKNIEKPKVFIGSSSEALSIANALAKGLNDVCQADIWDQGTFIENENYLENLLSKPKNTDLLILVLTEENLIYSRNEFKKAPKDNLNMEVDHSSG